MQRVFSLHFEPGPQLPRTARKSLEPILLRSPLDSRGQQTFLLAVSELTSNLLRHSSRQPDQVQLECRWDDRCIELRIWDNGSPFEDADTLPDLEQILEGDLQTGGYGLAMLQASFDRVQYSTLASGFNVWHLQQRLGHKQAKQQILLVDDDPVQLEMLKLYLDNQQVTAFDNPLDALQWLRQNQPDLIISDICMPQMNGFHFRQQVSEYPHLNLTPFIFLTGDSDEDLAKNSTCESIDDYILKPINKEQIQRISSRVLQRQQDLLKRTHALVDHELKHHLRSPLPRETPYYRIESLAFSAHLGGGDYWFCQPRGDQLLLLLGDIMGHDLQACFMAGRQQGFFQALAGGYLAPEHEPQHPAGDEEPGAYYLRRFNQWLDHYQPALLSTLALIVAEKDDICFYNAGALPPWRISADGLVASVPHTGSLPGLGTAGDNQAFRFSLAAGERLLLFSDGLIETSADYTEQQLRCQQLIRLLSEHATAPLETLKTALKTVIEQAPVSDDISVILLERR